MTFLEYLCERLLGPRAKPGGSAGDSYWCCPFHGGTSFHTMPSKEGLKDRWLCFGCGMRGDDADLMKHFYPGDDWPRRRARLMEWREDWERECEATAPAPTSGPAYFSPGTGRRTDLDARREAEERRLDQLAENAWDDLTDSDRRELIRLKDKVGDEVSLDLLARVCRRFREWFIRTDAEHRAECKDPDCEARVCRVGRGFSAMNGEAK